MVVCRNGVGSDLAYQMAHTLRYDEPNALAILGYMHEKGRGPVDKSPKIAMQLYFQALDKNSTDAMLFLGRNLAQWAIDEKDPNKKEEFQQRSMQLMLLAGYNQDPRAIAFLCTTFYDESEQDIANIGAAWCHFGSSLVNDENSHYFNDSPINNSKPLRKLTPSVQKELQHIREKSSSVKKKANKSTSGPVT